MSFNRLQSNQVQNDFEFSNKSDMEAKNKTKQSNWP